MNPIRKLWCRTYQAAFHIAIPLLPYRNPAILTSLSDLPSLLASRNVRRVMIVTDRTLHELGMLDPLKQGLTEADIAYAVYDGTVPNPTVQNASEALSLYRKDGCTALIGFGGGSAIDCAKAVGALLACPKKTLPRMSGILRVRRRIPLLAAIPTTAGTGSEVTVTTVISDPAVSRKYTISDFPLIPRIAVLDPSTTLSMPPSMTAATGMDALTHAVEAFIGRSTTRSTRRDALEATRLIFTHLEVAYRDGSNREARTGMMQAAFLAGRAFSKSYVGYGHAVAHSLGGQYNIPHGLANAVLLPIVLEAYGKAAHKKLRVLAIAAGVATPQNSPEAAATAIIRAVRDMNDRMGIPRTLSGIRREDIPTLARHADKEANPLYPVPVLMDAAELEEIYKQVADWSHT